MTNAEVGKSSRFRLDFFAFRITSINKDNSKKIIAMIVTIMIGEAVGLSYIN